MGKYGAIKAHVPNTITLSNLAVGCIAAKAAFGGQLTTAALLILLCAVLDFFDGFMARMLHAYSEIGKQLDSLADLVSFGVAPAAIAYKIMQGGLMSGGIPVDVFPGSMMLVAPLSLVLFSALRLARFNILHSASPHFSGLPVPADAGAFAALALVLADMRFEGLHDVVMNPYGLLALILVNSWLMVAPMSMFSFKLKSYRPSRNRWRYAFALVSAVLICILRGLGLFAAFLLYVIGSMAMNIVLRIRGSKC